MIKKIWNNIEKTGLRHNSDALEEQNIILVNSISFLTATFCFLLILILFVSLPGRGWTNTRLFLLGAGVFYFGNIIFNSLGKFQFSKLIICCGTPLFILFISIFDKQVHPEFVTIKDFFFYRFMALCTTIFPLLVFRTKDLLKMILCSIPGFFVLVFGDQIHEWLGVGLGSFGYQDPSKLAFDIMVGLAFLALFGFIFNLKNLNERYYKKIDNQKLELEKQNFEITAQSEKLRANHDHLINAKKIIEDQNQKLEMVVAERTKNLLNANEQLVIQKNELTQFSFAISHNLKSPVTSLKGLLNLFEDNELSPANKEVYDYMYKTVDSMIDLFSDLNEIIDLRNELYQKTSLENLDKEVDYITDLLRKDIISQKVKINFTRHCETEIVVNKHKLRSILLNLISNSIKYRSPERTPEIDITVKESDGFFRWTVRDNGLGMDMQEVGERLFQIFQRFHSHVEGKGLGLYLINLQVESMGGEIKVESEPGEFTLFKFTHKKIT
ncbi:sensor histidine kinase [Flexithrix dorotheae]|uniref:sensor histidine kinase n=1 Tax=Flexithrix dorotheae TaxID=70993 RepID=UPI000378086B|nr:HAMP domain-containing sensor histidine kinase [Flexithrix dorotheae]